MKNFFLSLVMTLLLLGISGCQIFNQHTDVKLNKHGFPKSMIGLWETEVSPVTKSKWSLKFEEDGTIRKMIHGQAGPVNLIEGGVLGKGAYEDSEYAFAFGDVEVEYDKDSNELKVIIPVNYFVITLPQGTIEGDMKDVFTGPVDQAGEKWITKRLTYSNLEGGSPVSDEFVEENADEMVFHKVDLEEIRKQQEQSK